MKFDFDDHSGMNASSVISSGKSLTSQAFDRLRADILAGLLSPGDRLRIQTLSEQYDVGTTAIREALSRLVSDGFVDFEDQRGFCVTPVSRDELVDLTQTRIEIEAMALRHAMERGGIDWESNLLGSFHRLSRTPAPTSPELHAAWEVMHRQFHEALLAGCASPLTLRLFRMLYDKSERYRNLAERYTSEKNRDPGTEHQQLMEAAMQRDAERACHLLSEHYWKTTEIVLQQVFTDTPRPENHGGRKARRGGAVN